jgi:hypothetical protein
MKENHARLMIGILGMILVISGLGADGGQLAWAQGPALGASPDSAPSSPTVYITPTMSYQGKLVESGSPVTGDRSMTFRLFTASGGGTAIWTEGPKTVSVNNGLFTVTLGDTTSLLMYTFAQPLYLEIEVAGTILPRQVLQGAPYALSLAPGASVAGNSAQSVLSASNSGSGNAISAFSSSSGNGTYSLSAAGHGVWAQGLGGGLPGSALLAENLNTTNGIAIHGYNDSADTTLALSNDGTGDLLKGFGSDGGEDEFRFKNNGTFQDKQSSWVTVPGSNSWALLPDQPGGVLLLKGGPSVAIYAYTTGIKGVYLFGTLPSVLYGQPVEIRRVKISYVTDNSANYIDETKVTFESTGGVINTYKHDFINRDSTDYTSYDLYPDYPWFLQADTGSFGVEFQIYFSDIYNRVIILSALIELGHHPLY